MNEDLILELNDLFHPLLSAAGVDLVRMVVRQQGKSWEIEVFADKPQGGISIGECANLNRQMVTLLESSRKLGDDFSIEVSSPGLDWPLTTRKDFLRTIGRPLRVFLVDSVAGKLEHEGVVQKVLDETIELKLLAGQRSAREKVAGTLDIPLNKIRKAVQII